LKKRDLARMGSKRTAHLRHTGMEGESRRLVVSSCAARSSSPPSGLCATQMTEKV